MRKQLLSVTALAFAVGMAASAPAMAATFFNTPGAIQPGENVLLNTGDTGTVIYGITNKTGTSVTFESLSGCDATLASCTAPGEEITAPANGQARVEGTDGDISALRFFLTDGGGFTEFEFNLFKSIDLAQSVTIFSNLGNVTFDLDGNGQNYFSGIAGVGELFTAIAFETSGDGATDLRQLRLVGGAVAIPEPATWAMMIGGFAAVGSMVRRRRALAAA